MNILIFAAVPGAEPGRERLALARAGGTRRDHALGHRGGAQGPVKIHFIWTKFTFLGEIHVLGKKILILGKKIRIFGAKKSGFGVKNPIFWIKKSNFGVKNVPFFRLKIFQFLGFKNSNFRI